MNTQNGEFKVMEKSFENMAYSWEMFLIEHFREIRKLHFGDYDSYIIMQVINSHFIYMRLGNENPIFSLFDLQIYTTNIEFVCI